MKTGKIAAIAMIATAVGGSAFAADLPSRKAPPPPAYVPPPPPIMTWTGFYGGLNLGGGWSANRANPNNFALYGSPVNGATYVLPSNTKGGNSTGGVVGGGQVGYNYQIGSFVLGAETDFQGTSMRSGGAANTALYPDPAGGGALLVPLSPAGNRGIALNWFGTVRGRAGLLVAPTLLVYGTGGFAYGNLQSQFTGASSTRTGWTAGGGAEWMFMPNWSAKGEYLFTDLNSGGAQSVLAATATDRRHTQYNVVRAGVNYHFNLGGAPSLTSY
ncbi:outer membrane protein [Methylocystis iwaonis]|uniref:outer membrane protein n=1 Tax=Methylocystis iwaonis TaxID=2885079 RepID=UPI002E7BAB00|nr:outer membrane beta-barrel protein [Methylocystis iwaonis]